MARTARERSSTGIYHVMFRGINRQAIFEDEQDKTRFLNVLDEFKDISGYVLYGYCLMDNHVHLLIKETDETISGVIKRISSSYVYWYNAKYGRCGHLFQERFKSEAIETDSYFLTVLRYIHQNPLKAGSAKTVKEYKWTSYREYIKDSKIIDADYALNYFSAEGEKALALFIAFMNAESSDQCLDDVEKRKLTDDEVREHLKELGFSNPTHIQHLGKSERDYILKELKKTEGMTTIQISRVTGISKNIVYRA